MKLPDETIYLNPHRKLVDEVADWLCDRVRIEPGGAHSLAHVTVIVPTAQSGRQLRLRLARAARDRGWGGVLPPATVQPMHLLEPADESCATASSVQLRAAFLRFIGERPKRRTVNGRVTLDEWNDLFRAEYIADFGSHLSFLDQLNDIWRILAGGGLLMRDVASVGAAKTALEAAQGNETERWRQLAEFEAAFFDFLHARGLRHQAEAIHLAKTTARPLSGEIEQVVLPALVDPVAVLFDVLGQRRDAPKVSVLVHADAVDAGKFDAWGRPTNAAWTGSAAPVVEGIRNEDVVRAPTDAEIARLVARDFPPADGDRALPSLGLCDEALFPELSAAFLNAGYELHNPERHLLAVSSLGRIVDNLITLYRARDDGYPWEAFVALLREDDVIWPVLGAIGKDEKGRSPGRQDVMKGLDICRNTYLPRTVPKACAFDETRLEYFEKAAYGDFRAAALAFMRMLSEALAEGGSAVGFLRAVLQRVYARRYLRPDGADREFQAAANALGEALDVVDDETVRAFGLSEGALANLLRRTVSEASYSLEPDSKSAIKTEGWLELAWSGADKVALAGFHEGAVPDSVIGHAFLPDALRKALGLTSNDQRLARDTFLLKDILDARSNAPGSVRAYVAQTNNVGDIRRPSRLLFLVPSERLAARTERLFGELPPGGATPAQTIAPGWGLALPDEVRFYRATDEHPEGRLTASAIDTWLKCPFTYLFKYGLGMNRVEEKTELEANDFGTIVHNALEAYAREQCERTRRGLAQLHDERDIAASFEKIMASLRDSFGANPSVNLRLQLDSAVERLKCFARIQAKWAQDGWSVAEDPEYGFLERPFEGEDGCDTPIRGSVDRIDFKPGVGYRLIDYKTWDDRAGAWSKIMKGGAEQARHAERLRLPVLSAEKKGGAPSRFLTVQLPLYGRCIEKKDAKFRGRIADYCYVLLGKTPADSAVLGSADDQGGFEAVKKGKKALVDHVELALETARAAIRRIRANIFWPPGPTDEWKWEVADLLAFSPERDFPKGMPWRDAQERKLDALGGCGTEVTE